MVRLQILISCLLIVLSIVHGTEVTSSASIRRDCPRNWTKYERTKSCLMVNEQRLKWSDAEKYCQKFGAHLASVADVFENNFVFDFAKQINLTVPTVWLGKLTRPDKNTPYEWHDGSQKVFRQTNFSGSMICLTMWLDMERAEVSWNEWDCNYVGYSSVCKKNFRRNPQQITASTHLEGQQTQVNQTSTKSPYHASKRCCISCTNKCGPQERCIPNNLNCLINPCKNGTDDGWCLPIP